MTIEDQLDKEMEANLNAICREVRLPQDEYGRLLVDNLHNVKQVSLTWLKEAYLIVKNNLGKENTALWLYFNDMEQELTFLQALKRTNEQNRKV